MPRTLPLPVRNFKDWGEFMLPRIRAAQPEEYIDPAESKQKELALKQQDELRKFGRHIYIFRNIETNQILYALRPRIEQKTLKQLPFIGKHSVPPKVRPDLWAPYCRVGPFPTAKQGQDALKKLQEIRKLNLYHWKETNEDVVKQIEAENEKLEEDQEKKSTRLIMNWHETTWGPEQRKRKVIRQLMDYRANATADLARVFSIQTKLGQEIEVKRQERREEREAWLEKKLEKMRSLAKGMEDGRFNEKNEKIKVLEAERASARAKAQTKEVRHLKEEIDQLSHESRKIFWAARTLEKIDETQKEVDKVFEEARTEWGPRVAASETATSETADEAQPPYGRWVRLVERFSENGWEKKLSDNPVARGLLPEELKEFSKGYTLDGVECHWADLYDSLYASTQWPQAIVHDTLDAVNKKRENGFVTEQDWEEMTGTAEKEIQQAADEKYNQILHDEELKGQSVDSTTEKPLLEQLKQTEQAPSGLGKLVPGFVRNRFGSSEARV